MTTYNRPRQIIDYCLAPLGLEPGSADYTESYRRLEHVIKTFQLAASRAPVAVDFSQMRTQVINEAAHGD